jgi:hypothetical protein
MRCDFLESVDAGNRRDTGLLVDFELVAFGCLDFFAIRKPDHEHGCFLSIEWLAVAIGRLQGGLHGPH